MNVLGLQWTATLVDRHQRQALIVLRRIPHRAVPDSRRDYSFHQSEASQREGVAMWCWTMRLVQKQGVVWTLPLLGLRVTMKWTFEGSCAVVELIGDRIGLVSQTAHEVLQRGAEEANAEPLTPLQYVLHDVASQLKAPLVVCTRRNARRLITSPARSCVFG